MLIRKYIYCSLIVSFISLTDTLSQDNSGLYLEMTFDKDKVIATVDTIKITAEEFYLSYEFGPAFIKRSRDSREKHLEYMINEKLLALDGYSRNVQRKEETSSLINEFSSDIASEELFKDSILSKVTLDENEITELIKKKQITVDIRWLFSNNEEEINHFYSQINKGANFDSLYQGQIITGAAPDERSMSSNIYQIEKKNPALIKVINTLKAGEISSPIHQEDGWYIILLDNITQNVLTSESEYERLRQEAVNALTKKEMDQLSDSFVNELLVRSEPVIKRDAFKIVRAYLGRSYLKKEKYNEWQLEEKLNEALEKTGDKIDDIPLVTLSDKSISNKQFIEWFRNRSQYIKFDESSFAGFSISLEKLIWRMVRDYLLGDISKEYGYFDKPGVKRQINWWKDKITGSAVRNEIANSIQPESLEQNSALKNRSPEEMSFEFQKRMLHKILSLKQKYRIKVFNDELQSLPLSAEEDKRAIDLFTIKNSGIIPRTPYPTINQEWVNWE